MDGNEMWAAGMERGDASEMSKITGKSVELYSSWGRRVASDDYPNGTGNASPTTQHLAAWDLFFLVNPRGALQLHALLDAHVRSRATAHANSLDVTQTGDAVADITKEFCDWVQAERARKPPAIVEKELQDLIHRAQYELLMVRMQEPGGKK